MNGFDYEIIHRCEFPVDGFDLGCGEPAIAKGSWVDSKGTITSIDYLCQKHLALILKDEEDVE